MNGVYNEYLQDFSAGFFQVIQTDLKTMSTRNSSSADIREQGLGLGALGFVAGVLLPRWSRALPRAYV